MRIRTWLAAAVTAVLLAIPVQAFAAQDTDTQAPTWDGATWTQEVLPPVAEPATDESPQEATVVTRIILADIDMNLYVGVPPRFVLALSPSDPNYGNIDIPAGSDAWFPSNPSDDGMYPGHVNPPLPKEGVLYQHVFAIKMGDGLSLANDFVVTCKGVDYQARVLGGGEYMTVAVGKPVKPASEIDRVPVYRMYNTKTSEHMYTRSAKEYNSCGSGSYADWRAEGVAWYAPKVSAKPVYRLYNLKSGDHHYTTSANEKAKLIGSGQWRDEGVAFYSAQKDDGSSIPIYRVYNGKLKRGQHHYTKSAAERDSLVKNSGWRDEGVGFYGYLKA